MVDPSALTADTTPELDELQRVQLTRTMVLWQRRRGHRSATDDVLCAWAASILRPGARRILELGAGQGSVTLMLAGALPGAHITAVEAQDISMALLGRNLAANAPLLSERVRPVHGDLREVNLSAGESRTQPFELACGSPPWIPLGAGTLPADAQRAGGRFELRGGVEGYLEAADRWLDPSDGVAAFLMDGDSDARTRAAIAGVGLHLLGATAVTPRAGAAVRFRIYALGRQPGASPLPEALTVRDADGAWTPAFQRIRHHLDLPSGTLAP